MVSLAQTIKEAEDLRDGCWENSGDYKILDALIKAARPRVVTDEMRESIERINGWRHLRKYSGMSDEWMDAVRDAILWKAIR